MQRYIEIERAKPITDKEIRQLVVHKSKLKVRDYGTLSTSDTLPSLCPGIGHGCVLFWLNKKNEVGHFNLLLRHGKNEYEFFDSYGKTIHEIAANTSHDGGETFAPIVPRTQGAAGAPQVPDGEHECKHVRALLRVSVQLQRFELPRLYQSALLSGYSPGRFDYFADD